MIPLVTPLKYRGALFWDRRRPRLQTLQLRFLSGDGAGETPAVPEERARYFSGVTKGIKLRFLEHLPECCRFDVLELRCAGWKLIGIAESDIEMPSYDPADSRCLNLRYMVPEPGWSERAE